MRQVVRKLLAVGLAVLYGGISLIGYGLHEFSPAHRHADSWGHVHAHGGCMHHHHHAHAPIPDQPGFSDAHDCDICYLLDQFRSELPQLVLINSWQSLVDSVPPAYLVDTTETPLGLHSPRGPPTVIS